MYLSDRSSEGDQSCGFLQWSIECNAASEWGFPLCRIGDEAGNGTVINWNWITFCLLHKAVQLKDPSGVPTYVKCINIDAAKQIGIKPLSLSVFGNFKPTNQHLIFVQCMNIWSKVLLGRLRVTQSPFIGVRRARHWPTFWSAWDISRTPIAFLKDTL
jgi:hypothetical protein